VPKSHEDVLRARIERLQQTIAEHDAFGNMGTANAARTHLRRARQELTALEPNRRTNIMIETPETAAQWLVVRTFRSGDRQISRGTIISEAEVLAMGNVTALKNAGYITPTGASSQP
jgi:hypothetical protein